jgi:hypothetical protein
MKHANIAPELSENDIQKSVFAHFARRSAPNVFAFHPKNGGVHQVGRRAGINAGLGVVSGITDVIAIEKMDHGRLDTCRVYALELKRESRRGKGPSGHENKQEKTRHRMSECGVICGVAYGLDEALEWLEGHGLLSGERQ